MLSNLAVVGEAKRRHTCDVGLPLSYSTQTQSLKILPEDVQACLYLLLCKSERIGTVTDFMLKGLKFPHWRQVFGNCSCSVLCCVHPPSAANRTRSGTAQCHSRSESPPDVGCNTCTQHWELLGKILSPGSQLFSWSPKWERPIGVRAWAPLSLSSLPLPPTATTSFLPFDHYKSDWHWQWGGSSDSNDLSFAHIVLLLAVPLYQSCFWLSSGSDSSSALKTSLINKNSMRSGVFYPT